MTYFDQFLNDHDLILIDGGLSNVLESYGCDLNHPLWTAKLLSENPEAIIQAHYDYIVAGAQCVATMSYQATVKGFMIQGFSEEASINLIRKSVDLAWAAIERAISEGLINERPLVAASMGPYGAFLADGSEYRGNYEISRDELADFHMERIQLLQTEKIDLYAFETVPSYPEARVLSELLNEVEIPSWISFSCKDEAHINDGTSIEDCIYLFKDHPSVFALGVNCTPPTHITGLIQKMKDCQTGKKILVYPNSGEVYDPVTKKWLGLSEPLHFLKMGRQWIDLGAEMIGGCCRIGPEHIRELGRMLEK
jgi:homocysteine S-methyltransferase